MKKLLLLLVFVVGMAPLVFAANPTVFVWRPPTNPNGSPITDLAGYRVFCGTQSRITGGPGAYTIIKDTGMQLPDQNGEVVYPINNVIPPGQDTTWYCAVTAYDVNTNESEFSNEVSFFLDQLAPAAPGGFGVR